MRKLAFILAILFIPALLGCSGGEDIVAPSQDAGALSQDAAAAVSALPGPEPHLWGFYEITIDIPTQTVQAIPLRHSMFTANVVSLLNPNPAALKFKINGIDSQPGYVDIDLDISITHPFAGLTKYNGYDVRGIFMGNGTGASEYNPDWKIPVLGTDQYMLPSPSTGFGGPDGYTRWFNRTEFNSSTLPMVEYTPGIYASPGFAGTATLCPYKYFADGLGPTDDAFAWLAANPGTHGVFSAGSTNKRNYYLRFPVATDITFGYAIAADWKGPGPAMHPANTRETVAINVEITPDIYYVNESEKGGSLILDVSIFDWFSEPTGGVMEDYRIFIVSTVLDSFKKITNPAVVESGEHWYKYHLVIPADNITGTEGNDFWLIVDYSGENYKNPYGVTNLCGNDLLAAAFHYDLYVKNAPYKTDPVCDLKVDPSTPANISQWDFEGDVDIKFDASGSYDPDGTELTYEWDFDGDGIFDEDPDDAYTGNPDKPTHTYSSNHVGDVSVHLVDENDGEAECSVDVSIGIHPSKNIPLRPGATPKDLAVDSSNGRLYILYSDKAIYRHMPGDYYDPEFADEFFILSSSHTAMNFMDVSDKGCFDFAAGYSVVNYDATGSPIGEDKTTSGSVMDVWTQPDDGGTYANEHHAVWGGVDGPYHFIYVERSRYPNFANQDLWFHTITQQSTTGYDQYYAPYIDGCEGMDSGNFWMLEGSPDYYCARWDYPSIEFDDAYFGTGSATNDDDGFNDPKDISHGTGDILYVLDRLSTNQGRVKAWHVEGDVVTSLGGFGDASNLSGAPLRIEGSEYINGQGDNYVFVLHGSSGNYKMSIFFPGDMPWG